MDSLRSVGGLGQFFGILPKGFDEHAHQRRRRRRRTGTRGFGRFISARHSGQIQTYLGVIAIGMLALLLLYAWLT